MTARNAGVRQPRTEPIYGVRRNEMSQNLQMKFRCVGLSLIVALALSAAALDAQDTPYRIAEAWPQLPSGMKWAGVISVDSDAHGNIWVFHRSEPTILEFAPSGKLVKSFGTGMFVQAHGMTLDRDGNIWVTDAQG